MKKIYTTFATLFFTILIYGQSPLPGDVDDYHEVQLKSAYTGSLNYENGEAFTPKGDFRALIVCVGFGSTWDNQSCGDWPTGSNTLPDWANNPEYMYDDYSDFTTYASSNHYQNISKFYHEMSGGNFRFIADVYENRINVDLTGLSSYSAINREAINVMKTQDPTFDWSPYDNRENSPNYEFDNSSTSSDDIVDFIIFVYRYNDDWSSFPITIPADGVASNKLLTTFNYNSYTFEPACGYTHFVGGETFYNLFIHEVAHNVFDCPHYAMANSIVGDYFYGQHGWGMMKLNYVFNSAIGWERWLLGWIDIEASGINAIVNSKTDLTSNGEFILRDHITTGDAIRIKINNGTGANQYLWIENHQGISIFDDRKLKIDGCGNTISSSPRGMMLYIESIRDDKTNVNNDIFSGSSSMNGIKFIHSTGNFDYLISSTASSSCIWNQLYDFTENKANPISGQNRAEEIRWDINNDNTIYYNDAANMNPGNEQDWIAKRNGIETKDFMGMDMAFPTNQKYGMDTNPCLTSRPLYNESTETFDFAYLNGISVTKIADLSSNRIKVKVEFDNCDVSGSVRWTGNIALNNVTKNSDPDVLLKTLHTIIINKSGTPNRTTKIDDEFINYTNFKCEDGAFFKMEANSTVFIDENSTFTLEDGSTLEINDGARFVVTNESDLIVENGATIIVKGSGELVVKCDGQLCVNSGAVLNLQDNNSCIRIINNGSLSSACLTSLTSIITGSGSVAQYTNAVSLSNQTISTNSNYSGASITASNVTIQTGKDVIFDANGDITINGTFEVPLGATFETKSFNENCDF
jgi:hypothetical protein